MVWGKMEVWGKMVLEQVLYFHTSVDFFILIFCSVMMEILQEGYGVKRYGLGQRLECLQPIMLV